MNWVSGCTCFVCRVLPWLRIFTVTNTVHNFVFILYSMKSPESNYLCFFGNLRREASFVVTADNLTLLPTFRACTGCITGVKVVFIILCFVYFLKLFCCGCCHFRCFYCKMPSYGVNLLSLIHFCCKCALIQLLTIKNIAFP